MVAVYWFYLTDFGKKKEIIEHRLKFNETVKQHITDENSSSKLQRQ
jgi:hypothetical protein